MKLFCASTICLSILICSCSDDDDATGSRAYVLSDVNFQANIAAYDFPSKTLTPNFFTLDGVFSSSITAANKNEQSIYINTGYPSSLRKIDLATRAEIKSVPSWAAYDQKIVFHGDDVILCHLNSEPPATIIKIYDENLILKDSLSAPPANMLEAALVSENRLFVSVFSGEGNILIYDLSAGAFLDPVVLPGICWQLIPLDKRRMVAITNDNYFTLDAQTLQKSAEIEANIGSRPAVYDAAANKFYWLATLPQPSLHPYALKSMDLATGESENLNDASESIIPPMVFNVKSKVIHSGPGIKTFSTDGKLLNKIETNVDTKFILLD